MLLNKDWVDLQAINGVALILSLLSDEMLALSKISSILSYQRISLKSIYYWHESGTNNSKFLVDVAYYLLSYLWSLIFSLQTCLLYRNSQKKKSTLLTLYVCTYWTNFWPPNVHVLMYRVRLSKVSRIFKAI